MCDKHVSGSTFFFIAVTNIFLFFPGVRLIRLSLAGLNSFSLATDFGYYSFTGVNFSPRVLYFRRVYGISTRVRYSRPFSNSDPKIRYRRTTDSVCIPVFAE